MEWIFYLIAGAGAGAVTGLAGLSAAVIITPILVSLCGYCGYDAVAVALASDVLASLLSAYTYYKHQNIDLQLGYRVGATALLGTLIGSAVGYWFCQTQPEALGYISMGATVLLGIKFLVRPIRGRAIGTHEQDQVMEKTRMLISVLCGLGIGFVCGFAGSGGGVLMLTVFTLIMGRELKIAVGTATAIMSVIALVGAGGHIALGADIRVLPTCVVVISCVLTAWGCAKLANRCENTRLNRIVGVVLIVLGVITIFIKAKS